MLVLVGDFSINDNLPIFKYYKCITTQLALNSKHIDGKAMDVKYDESLESYLNNNRSALEGEGLSFLVHGEGSQKHIHIQYNN